MSELENDEEDDDVVLFDPLDALMPIAARVLGPAIPSTVSLFLLWKYFTASLVFAP